MVRALQSRLKVGLDRGNALFDILRFVQRLDLEDRKRFSVGIESLTLCGPEQLPVVDEQSSIACDIRVDVERVQRMRRPVVAQRRIGMEEIQLRTVITNFRL